MKKVLHQKRKKMVVVNDHMQKDYRYACVEPVGKNFDPTFKPDLTPKEMLKLGIFGGLHLNDCIKEFSRSWFTGVQFSQTGKHEAKLNYFGVNASQSLAEWKRKGWIYKDDPRGWFQWYCRYYMGRRIPKEDARQIKRWRAITRHIAQIKHNCRAGDIMCRPVQRQALLHWAYDSRKF